MGRLKDSILSGTSGRVGRVVVANVNGVEILKIRPKKTTKQPTEKQNLIKERFNKSILFMKSYKEYAKIFFGKKTGLKSVYNQASSSVLNAIECDWDNLTLIPRYNRIQFSKGNGLRPQPTAISSPSAMKIQIDWDNNAEGIGAENDYLVVLLAVDNDLEEETLFYETTVQRKDLSFEQTLLPRFQNNEIHLWIAFVDENGMYASDSLYLGTVLVT